MPKYQVEKKAGHFRQDKGFDKHTNANTNTNTMKHRKDANNNAVEQTFTFTNANTMKHRKDTNNNDVEQTLTFVSLCMCVCQKGLNISSHRVKGGAFAASDQCCFAEGERYDPLVDSLMYSYSPSSVNQVSV